MTGNKVHKGNDSLIFNGINTLLMCAVIFVVIYPIYYMVIVSVSSADAVMAGRVRFFPSGFHLDVYKQFLTDGYFLKTYKNTAIITLLGTSINIVMTIICAYPLSRRDFYGRGIITAFITFTMFFSGGMIPNYLLINQLKLLNTYWAVVLPGAVNVFNMIIMRTSFQGLPEELTESAYIDGANDLQLLYKVVLPLSKPIIATMVLFYAVAHWNGYVHAMFYFTDKNLYPVQLYLRSLVLSGMTESATLNMEMAAGVGGIAQRSIQYGMIIVSALPILVIYPFISRYFEKGVMVGALKG
ncbi:MAG: carbohydrate ABC transporter permease [Eubacteriales bacterium]|nr:carbohydrate ABC transporter permease [Eubacteriales bacterium]